VASVSRTKVCGAHLNLAKLAELRALPIFATLLKQDRALLLTTHQLANIELQSSSAGDGIGQRDLTAEEKKVIMDAVAQSLRNPGSAKYQWAKFPAVVTDGSVNYCATVDAQSPYAAYNGRQAYVVHAQTSGNRISSAVVGLIAGGKDFALVTNMCAKYGLDPRNAS
jgi:hypothetical protein